MALNQRSLSRSSSSALLALSVLVLGACPQPADPSPDSATAGEMTTTGYESTTQVPDESTTTTTGEPTTSTDAPTTTSTSSTDTTTSTSATTGEDSSTSTGGDEMSSTESGESTCGNGVIDPGEECDQGFKNDDAAACTKSCLKATCGDGYTFVDVEECDLGEANQDGVYGGCTPDCTLGPHCGDGIHDALFEQCDPADPDLGDVAVCESCVWTGKLVFASSEVYSGNLGGLSGADTKCQTLAASAEIIGEGRAFRAWLSDNQKDAASRLTHSLTPYILLDGTPIAANWADLTDGTLAHAIDRNEKNEVEERPRGGGGEINSQASSRRCRRGSSP